MKTYSLIDIMTMDQRFRTTFINSVVGFKCLNLVGTLNTAGKTNLAIFNSIFHVGAQPPYLGMVFRPDEVERHTLENILNNKHYTFNHVHEGIIRAAHQTSARYPKATSEFDACGLTPTFSKNCIAPYVLESSVNIALEFKEKINVATNNTIIVIGQILEINLPENNLGEDGFFDLEKSKTCTVAGLDAYYKTSKIERLNYAKPDKKTMPIN
jgi:flavin reductase (DIM6/NTAB) family NADH-FMN oxidoreductase RutF